MDNIFWLLCLLVPLVVIHELGHFIVAKLGGIEVSKFAFGFGKKLFGFHYRGTEYRWNLLPLGGYVDLMGELVYTNRIPKNAAHFYNKPKWIRFLVLLMGPLFNLLLAFGIYWVVFASQGDMELDYHGEPYTVGYVTPDSVEEKAGLRVRDRIVKINNEPVTSVDQVRETILLSPEQTINLEVLRDGDVHQISFVAAEHPIDGVGVWHFRPALVTRIRDLPEGMPAAESGLEPEDVITHVNGCPVNPYHAASTVQYLISERAPLPTVFTVMRGEEELKVEVAPEQTDTDQWLIGIQYGYYEHTTLTTIQAFKYAWNQCIQGSTLIYKGLKRLLMAQLSIKTLSSPIEMAGLAGDSARMGLWQFLELMALLSLNLGLMNLLPIPVLDGGEIFVLVVEWITGRDFNLETKMRIKMVGLFFLVGLMAIVLTSDVIKIFQRM